MIREILIQAWAASSAVQYAQLCVLAKSVSARGAGGTSDCMFWVTALKSGQNGPGNPRLAKCPVPLHDGRQAAEA